MTLQNLKPYRNLDCQATGAVVCSSLGKLAGWTITNQAASTRYVKLYDKATTPSNTDMPFLTIVLPAGSKDSVLGLHGINFSNGLGIRCTTVLADNDNTAPSTNDVVANLFYQLSGC